MAAAPLTCLLVAVAISTTSEAAAVVVAHVPSSAATGLLDRRSWTFSNALPRHPAWLGCPCELP